MIILYFMASQIDKVLIYWHIWQLDFGKYYCLFFIAEWLAISGRAHILNNGCWRRAICSGRGAMIWKYTRKKSTRSWWFSLQIVIPLNEFVQCNIPIPVIQTMGQEKEVSQPMNEQSREKPILRMQAIATACVYFRRFYARLKRIYFNYMNLLYF